MNLLRELWHEFRELHTGNRRVDRIEDTFNVVRDACLWIPQIQMTRSALQIEQDHAFRCAETFAAVASFFVAHFIAARGILKQRGKTQAS